MSLNVLLTGASGFIGQNLVRLLKDNGYDIWLLTKNKAIGRANPDVNVLTIDDYDPLSIEKIEPLLPSNIDCIVNLAAYGLKKDDKDGQQFFASNIVFAQALLWLAKRQGIKKFVSIGSISEYASCQQGELISENYPLTTAMYGASKAAFSLWGSAFSAQNGISFVHLRLFNVYGKGEGEKRLIPYMISNLSKNEAIDLTDGEQVRDFIHVDDVVECILASMKKMGERSVIGNYNVCTGHPVKVKELILTIGALLKSDRELLRFGAVDKREDEIMWAVGDKSAISALIDWVPKISLEVGLDRIINDHEK
ncbi:MAG: nucleoside-diphosphate-sugar epimerase [Phenylobacterium sp.]|jgi:nucleoside-diphosphate-sugar epimerase